ncbi:MAG: membrane protease subunit, stomatin/prohibitin [Deltaproteobacteria bacterium CG_4_10_14_0_2_um_filter_43_8]|nr:MAG: membrane protease subunit, stomatin/prohibitin [Deltaproteobacteria bacterium CG11_big_fil_rev_8_21_14_0_20_42_23]PJA20365.1 MAG: membrane protease subunit, stomatin/prohibitin [Deltaproteobacteria bacterium CG_4_10_14_0_2_um_filter_43_8]PJC64151.1 MAG: membrane protease subunit, stomatin/prohibitin [Deltaproteobacteria bacterium CG_4_9_14_0_2_um_filter_42_21]
MSDGPNFSLPKKQVIIAAAVFFVFILLTKAIVVVPAGHVGVQELFGKVSDRELPSGIRLINPLAQVNKLSVRTQQISETAIVPSKEGLTVEIDLSVLLSLEPKNAPQVYKTIGLNYLNVAVVPQVRSVVRGVTAEYEAKALYTAEREVVSEKMFNQLEPLFKKRGLRLEKVLLRSVKLPEILSTAIEKKLEEEQRAEQMKFVLDRERQQAERKRIEAQGIADYNRIASQSLNSSILKLRGLEATQKLAESNNSKVVIIGNSKDGLPLILGNE